MKRRWNNFGDRFQIFRSLDVGLFDDETQKFRYPGIVGACDIRLDVASEQKNFRRCAKSGLVEIRDIIINGVTGDIPNDGVPKAFNFLTSFLLNFTLAAKISFKFFTLIVQEAGLGRSKWRHSWEQWLADELRANQRAPKWRHLLRLDYASQIYSWNWEGGRS